jgi:Flp pilus assembly protein TadD
MDQLSAHLDRGWDLVQRGDTRGAEVSARRALELDGEAPEAYNLLGYVAALHGDFDEAMEHYQHAIALDDTYLEAILNAAEVLIHPLGELEEAERYCDDALELAETDDERVDALLLKFDALLGQDQVDAAKSLCARFPTGPFENPAHAFLVGRAFYEIGDLAKASPLIEESTNGQSGNGEAFYYLGLLRDEQERSQEATQAFLTSRQLDVATPGSDWGLSFEAFRALVDQAVASLPEKYRAVARADDIFVADLPGVEVVVEGVDPRALLLLDAVGQGADAVETPAEDSAEAEPTDDAPRARMFIYRRNVERLGASVEAVMAELAGAMERELEAAFFDNAEE